MRRRLVYRAASRNIAAVALAAGLAGGLAIAAPSAATATSTATADSLTSAPAICFIGFPDLNDVTIVNDLEPLSTNFRFASVQRRSHADASAGGTQHISGRVTDEHHGAPQTPGRQGIVQGTVSGTGVNFAITGTPMKGSAYVYSGSLDRNNFLSGTAYDRWNPDRKWSWHVLTPVGCTGTGTWRQPRVERPHVT